MLLKAGDLETLIPSWERSLRAANKAPRTIDAYVEAAELFAAFQRTDPARPTDVRQIRRGDVEAYLADMLSRTTRRGKPMTASTVAGHFRRLQQLFGWLLDEDEIDRSPMERMKAPAVPEQPVPVFTTAELDALIASCAGKTFEDRRDHAMMLVLLDAGVRLEEMSTLTIDTVDLDTRIAWVYGKGRRERPCPFGTNTANVLDRYLRVRRAHKDHGLPALWLGRRGRLTGSGVAQALTRRASVAGIADVHPHRFRHTWAHLLKTSGMSDGDLMQLAGWRSVEMAHRYGKSAATERAIARHREMSPGDQHRRSVVDEPPRRRRRAS